MDTDRQNHRLDPIGGEGVHALADPAADQLITGTCETRSQPSASAHLKARMAQLPIHKSDQLIEAELLRQVQRAQQVLLSADEDCIDRARRHYRNVLDVFSGLIFDKRPSQAAKAMRYLRLHQRIAGRLA
jgi:hypothetical protein